MCIFLERNKFKAGGSMKHLWFDTFDTLEKFSNLTSEKKFDFFIKCIHKIEWEKFLNS